MDAPEDADVEQDAGTDRNEITDEEIQAGDDKEFECIECRPDGGKVDPGERWQGEHSSVHQRVARTPGQPTKTEREQHELTHCPPRSWCDHCMKGQAKDDSHVSVSGDLAESDVVRVAIDYCFFQEEMAAQEAKMILTVLVMAETLCHSIWAYAVGTTGVAEAWVSEQIVEDMDTIGLANERIITKADQEASITDVQNSIVAARGSRGTAIEQSKVGDSNSNGRIERAIQDFKGLVRTLRSALESAVGERIHLDHPVVPWMVRHAAHTITQSRVRENGRTAYQLMKGRRSNAKLVPFAETVLFKVPHTQHKVGDFENRWEQGVWLGFVTRSGEHLVGTERGVFRVSTVMRRPAGKRWSMELLNKIGGTPELPVPGAPGRRIPAYAKKFEDSKPGQAVFVPAKEPETEVRVAYVYRGEMRCDEMRCGEIRCGDMQYW